MDEETVIPLEYIEFCKQVSQLAEKYNLSRISMKITPGFYGPTWGSDINMYWEHGPHGDHANRVNISSEITVYAKVD